MTDRGIQYDEDSLLAEAADWLVCLISGEATEDDAARLAAWRATSSAHEAAFRDIAGVRSYAFVASKSKKPAMVSRTCGPYRRRYSSGCCDNRHSTPAAWYVAVFR